MRVQPVFMNISPRIFYRCFEGEKQIWGLQIGAFGDPTLPLLSHSKWHLIQISSHIYLFAQAETYAASQQDEFFFLLYRIGNKYHRCCRDEVGCCSANKVADLSG